MSHAEEFLAHFGVKGMRWGVRGGKGTPSADSARSTTVRTTVKKSGVKSVSNKDLQDAINRMQLEQNFKRLTTNERSPVTRFIASTLQEVGKREIQTQVAKKLVKTVAKGGV